MPYISRLAPLLPRLVMAYQRRSGDLPDSLKAAGQLGQRHVSVLVLLAICGQLGVSELAERTGMTVAHASLVVGDLAKAGLADREHDPQDRRRILVSLSSQARPAVAEMRARNAEPVLEFLGQLTEEQAESFVSSLALLLTCLERAAEPGQPSS
jgi:DNA-binding MarR family transcriptional regulator